MQDMKAYYRGADVGSDHKRCIAKVKMKLKATGSITPHPRIDSQRLKAETAEDKFRQELKNRLEILDEMDDENIGDV